MLPTSSENSFVFAGYLLPIRIELAEHFLLRSCQIVFYDLAVDEQQASLGLRYDVEINHAHGRRSCRRL